MILNNFLTLDRDGLYCRVGDFYIDPPTAVGRAVISHAHGDHAARGNTNVYCTAATQVIMQHRYQKNAGRNFLIKDFDEPFLLNGVEIRFFPAGHILGSAQVLMKYGGVSYLYTGDYKLQRDATCEDLTFIPADVLITEATFADPGIKHPEAEDEICKLNAFDHNVLLGSYALGKAQRMIRLITDHCPDKKVLVHHSILPLNKIYESFGYAPGRYEPYTRKAMKQADQGFIYIVPPLTFRSYIRAKNVVRAFASGWKNLQVDSGLQLLISDHVDWQGILTMIERVKPEQVWTLHGNGRHLQEHFQSQIIVKLMDAC